MKYFILNIILLIVIDFSGKAQTNKDFPIDSTLANKISISDFCLCQTTLNELKELAPDIKQVEVEELDYPKECIGEDSRFETGIGYSSIQFPGIIFQKEKNTDLISKFRLTKSFKGNLPNDSLIDVENLKLSDVFLLYPEFKDKWLSRGCSEYWKFSNDTISFYVKIDKSIKPQFPINKIYYLDKPIEAIDLVISCYSIYNKTSKISLFNPNDPLFYLDSIRVNKGVLSIYDENEIAFINVFKDENAVKIAGNEGKNGVIFIYTKEYAKQKYCNYLKSKSSEYTRIVSENTEDNSLVYILNDKVLEKNYESELFGLNDKNFVDLRIIDSKKLKKEYKIKNKKWGIIISSTVDK
ncbi:hypothetical protein [Plebeiibacterium marinum]|uniref:Uncharacterized protein n=1 Tax=Plebeiibacterium marinum TaxID=2992111 RepID=A0AAE3MID2_9BACT|nr:hypothetical protein [Plebeiobacterium marinum]MCW3808079.1 hypothetical protein [Plebeiobacterium marinum]